MPAGTIKIFSDNTQLDSRQYFSIKERVDTMQEFEGLYEGATHFIIIPKEEIEVTKVCNQQLCIHMGKPQPTANFYRNRAHHDNLSHSCKDCDRETGKRSYQKHRYAKTGFTDLLIGGGK